MIIFLCLICFSIYCKNSTCLQKWRENDFWRGRSTLRTYWEPKNFVEIALFHTISEKNGLLHFDAENQDGRQTWQASDFWQKKCKMTLCIPWG